MGDGVGIPAFGEHAHTDHTADVLPKLARAPHGVDHFAQQVAVGQGIHRSIGVGHAVLAFESLDFGCEDALERFVDLARMLQRVGVDQQSGGAPLAFAGDRVVVGKKLQRAESHLRAAVSAQSFVAGDELVDLFGHGGVAAHHDEHGWRAEQVLATLALLAQPFVIGLVMGIKLLERLLEQRRQLRRWLDGGRGLSSLAFASRFIIFLCAFASNCSLPLFR